MRDGRAKPLMDRKVLEVSSLSLSLSLTIYLPTSLSSMYLSIYRSFYLSLSLFHLITYLPIYLSIHLSIYLSLSLFHLSICLAVYLSDYLSIYLIYLIYLSIYLSIYRSIVVVVVVVVVGVVVVVAVVVEVRVVKLVKLLKLVKLVKLISVYFFDISTSKKAQNPQFFTLLTSKCASRHNGVHFFDTFSTSEPPKVVRTPGVLYILTCFEMCFAPQRRALFRHHNFQKWSGAEAFCTFWLGNVLRATTACTFSTSQLPKVVRRWGVLYILTSKCASRHNGVHFFDIATSKSGPRMVCFVHFDFKMCFAPQRRAIFHLSSGQLAPHPPL